MGALVEEHESRRTAQGLPLKVEAVLVQGVSVDEYDGQVAPRRARVWFVDLDVQLDPVTAPNDPRRPAQLPQAQPTPWCRPLAQPASDHDSFCGEARGGSDGRRDQGDPGHPGSLGRVH